MTRQFTRLGNKHNLHVVVFDAEAQPALRFHSLPLHVATKARLDHKEQMKRLEMPRWTKLLEEYG